MLEFETRIRIPSAESQRNFSTLGSRSRTAVVLWLNGTGGIYDLRDVACWFCHVHYYDSDADGVGLNMEHGGWSMAVDPTCRSNFYWGPEPLTCLQDVKDSWISDVMAWVWLSEPTINLHERFSWLINTLRNKHWHSGSLTWARGFSDTKIMLTVCPDKWCLWDWHSQSNWVDQFNERGAEIQRAPKIWVCSTGYKLGWEMTNTRDSSDGKAQTIEQRRRSMLLKKTTTLRADAEGIGWRTCWDGFNISCAAILILWQCQIYW